MNEEQFLAYLAGAVDTGCVVRRALTNYGPNKGRIEHHIQLRRLTDGLTWEPIIQRVQQMFGGFVVRGARKRTVLLFPDPEFPQDELPPVTSWILWDMRNRGFGPAKHEGDTRGFARSLLPYSHRYHDVFLAMAGDVDDDLPNIVDVNPAQ